MERCVSFRRSALTSSREFGPAGTLWTRMSSLVVHAFPHNSGVRVFWLSACNSTHLIPQVHSGVRRGIPRDLGPRSDGYSGYSMSWASTLEAYGR
jgi:hypothetical protein